ncbi:Sorbin and SH3 domain-containing protein 1 [Pseudolycoriella hygida]|uniref:Sorbin and SH3 domain-containing protein 1 n=1 Tax=Pseudolycoriella hygida TaxID=35572 RepID=A0A9Q0N2H9_9DIPT|nr:Sorbin and SH3 domain-containing protein 1 [Pseudolycoriella hygida]
MPMSTDKFTATKSIKKLSTGGTIKTADFSFSSNKLQKNAAKNDEKSVRLTVASSSNPKESAKLDGRSASRCQTPVKTNVTRTSRSCENKFSNRSKTSSKSTSNLSLARTSSTYSIDSCNSKKRSHQSKSLYVIKSSSKETVFPLTISGKSRKKKANTKEKNSTIETDNRTIEVTTQNSLIREHEKSFDEQFDEAIRINRTDSFFQHLFLRDIPSPPPSIVNCVSNNNSVQEKARLWDTLTKKKDPKSKHQSAYLTNKRAVSGSKFKTMEHERFRQSRSLSPQKLIRPKCLFYDSVSKYDSFTQISDEEENFGSFTHDRTDELTIKFKEPKPNVYLTEVVRPNSPVVIHGKQSIEYASRSISPVRDIRSPSCRRIQQRRTESFKTNQRANQQKIVRARSLGSSDRFDSHLLTRNSNTIHPNSYENHLTQCSHQKSERFKELNKFYSNLERVGQLERATSSTDLRPLRKEGELIDFNDWKQVRDHEKAEKELNQLVGKLRRDEKEKDFLFRPKYVEDMKWNELHDSGLRTKEKSVEDLKEIFQERDQEDKSMVNRQDANTVKDIYKPLWRGNSVLDLASSMVVKYNPPVKTSSSDDTRIGLSKKLISTLTKDQVAKIKNQLSEIYNNNGPVQSEKSNTSISDKFVINVSSTDPPKNRSLVVRSSSLVHREELLGPVLKRHQERLKESVRSEVINNVHEPRASRSVERYEDLIKREQNEMSEAEKKNIFFNISKEIQDKLYERRHKTMAPIVLAKETRGAIASNIARNTLSTPKNSLNCIANSEAKGVISNDVKAPDKTFLEAKNNLIEPANLNGDKTLKQLNTETVQKKIHYFEKKKEETPETTIYHAREYSSPDEEEIMRIIEDKMTKKKTVSTPVQGRSSSASDFRELFGERDPGPARTRTPSPTRGKSTLPPVNLSTSTSVESVFRSRSVSPVEQKNYKTYYNIVRTGDVQKMKDKFESLTYKPRRNIIEIPPRRFQSDPDLNKIKRLSSPEKTTVKTHEAGDVSWITHKFEVKNSISRGRSRVRRVISPIQKVPFKKDDRFMPHIDIISKTASLKREMTKSPNQVTNLWTGEVQKIKNKFESPDRLSLMGQMYTSTPDISELKDISNYLTGPWIAHRYPKARDNARSHVSPDKGPISTICRKRVSSRPCSTSPPRSKASVSSILKPFYDMFANQDCDPMKNRSISRYTPDKRVEAELLWRRLQKNGGAKSTVKFQDTEVVPPPPPIKGIPLTVDNRDPEPQHRYVESDVNIHYKTPVRYEFKDPLSEFESTYRQAEQMKKLYDEERQRKYLQEMQDLSNRRHTDNFTPSQKSPIALNRYDDFGSNVSPKAPSLPRTVARALYNFHGQTSSRELNFKKGDIIYIRREIDKNWFEGEHNAAVGLLPSNYVEIISRDGIRVTQKKASEGQARAKFNFHAQSAIELSLNKGELVALTRRVDDNWFEGRIANRKGIFPVSYVDVLTDIGTDLTPIQSSKPIGSPAAHSLTLTSSPNYETIRSNYSDLSGSYQPNGVLREMKTIQKTEVLHVDTDSEPVAYRAIYKYRPQNSDELDLQEGDIVYVLEKCDDGWFVGTSQRTGYFGTFPGNYVERN